MTGPILDQLAGPIGDALDQVRAQFGDLGLVAGFGAVEGRCTAGLGSADGDATLAGAQIRLVLPDQAPNRSITLLDLPAHPEPNTHLTTNLSDVLDLVLEAVSTDLNESLDAAGAPLNLLIDAIQENIVTAIRDNVESNLAPLEQNLLDVTLNRQTRPTNDSIKVQALDLRLLPVVEEQLGSPLVNLQIGNAACGPSGRIEAAAAAPAAPQALPAIPKSVSAGYGSMPTEYAEQGHGGATIAIGALALLVAGSAGFVTMRRLRG